MPSASGNANIVVHQFAGALAQLALALAELVKASPDDPRRPGWPAGTPNSQGGKFRPKNESERSGNVSVEPRVQPSASGAVRRLIFQTAKIGIRWLARAGLIAADITAPEVMLGLEVGGHVAEWALPYIKAYFDGPQSLEALNEAAGDPQTGYDIHHIVEQATAADNGSEDALMNAPDNLARIPTLKHWELNAWYTRPNEAYGDQSPRQYLQGKSWDERRSVGLDGLRYVGVLQ